MEGAAASGRRHRGGSTGSHYYRGGLTSRHPAHRAPEQRRAHWAGSQQVRERHTSCVQARTVGESGTDELCAGFDAEAVRHDRQERRQKRSGSHGGSVRVNQRKDARLRPAGRTNNREGSTPGPAAVCAARLCHHHVRCHGAEHRLRERNTSGGRAPRWQGRTSKPRSPAARAVCVVVRCGVQ